MEKLLSITKNSEREVTITTPLENLEKEVATTILISYLSNATITYNLTLTLYKVELQNIIVFNYRGDEDSINNLIEHVEGLY